MARRPLADFVALLDAMGCETAAELDLLLYSSFDLDPCITEVGPGHLVVSIRDRGVEVRFPCTVQEFWDSVTMLESEARRRMEAARDDG